MLFSTLMIGCGADKAGNDTGAIISSIEESELDNDFIGNDSNIIDETELTSNDLIVEPEIVYTEVEYEVSRIVADYSDGFVWYEVSQDGKYYCAAVNTEDIVVFLSEDRFNAGEFRNGYAYIYDRDQDKMPGFQIVNDSGEIVFDYSEQKIKSIHWINDDKLVFVTHISSVSEDNYYVNVSDIDGNIVSINLEQDVEDIVDYIYAYGLFAISDGMYLCNYRENVCLINTNENTIIYNLKPSSLSIYLDELPNRSFIIWAYDNQGFYAIDPKVVDFSQVIDSDSFYSQIMSSGSAKWDILNTNIIRRNSTVLLYPGVIGTYKHYTGEMYDIYGNCIVNIPVMGEYVVKVSKYNFDDQYIGIMYRGVDSNYYITVYDSYNDCILYEPVMSTITDLTEKEGYLLQGYGLALFNPEGTIIKYTESSLLNDSIPGDFAIPYEYYACTWDSMYFLNNFVSRFNWEMRIYNGYYKGSSDYYHLDGTKVKTVKAIFDSNGNLVIDKE